MKVFFSLGILISFSLSQTATASSKSTKRFENFEYRVQRNDLNVAVVAAVIEQEERCSGKYCRDHNIVVEYCYNKEEDTHHLCKDEILGDRVNFVPKGARLVAAHEQAFFCENTEDPDHSIFECSDPDSDKEGSIIFTPPNGYKVVAAGLRQIDSYRTAERFLCRSLDSFKVYPCEVIQDEGQVESELANSEIKAPGEDYTVVAAAIDVELRHDDECNSISAGDCYHSYYFYSDSVDVELFGN